MSLGVSLGVSLMYLQPRCLGRFAVSFAVSLGVSLAVSLAVSLSVWFVGRHQGGLLAAGLLAAGGLAGGSTTPQQHRNWHGAARRLATAAVALLYRSARGSTSGLVCFGYGRRAAALRGSSASVRSARGGFFRRSSSSLGAAAGFPSSAYCPPTSV